MMNVREYFESLLDNEEMTLDETMDMEKELWGMYYEDYDGFVDYMNKHNVDLSLRDEEKGETYLTLWVWDMCGE
jgi:regulator of RNase E activity RraB